MTSRKKVTEAIRWSSLDIFTSNGVSFVLLIILSRILSPADFGITAMLAIFTTAASVVMDGGLSQSLIQRKHITHAEESSIFIFNVFMGFGIALLLYIAAPWIAAFYKQPILIDITAAMALNLCINSFGSIHVAMLTKRLEFKTLTKVSGVVSILSGLATLAAAVAGMGVWSLVIHALISSVLTVFLLWRWDPWRPVWVFNFGTIRTHFGFSGYLMFSNLLYQVYGNAFALIIGRLHTVHDVGFYNQAQKLQQLPILLMTSVISRVTFPVFSNSIEDKARLVRLLRQALAAAVFMSIPAAIMMLLLAEPLILTVYGEKWRNSIPVLEALSIAALLMPIQILNISMLTALGRADLNARLALLKFAIGISFLLLSSPYGIIAIAIAFTCANVVNVFINTHYSKRFLNYSALHQFRDLFPYFLAAVPMAATILLLRLMNFRSNFIELVVCATLGGGVYLLACKFSKLGALDHLLEMLGRKKNLSQ